jgi:aspartate aminotransferase
MHAIVFLPRMTRQGTESAFEVLVRARELEAAGKDVVHLEIVEPDFATPAKVVNAAPRTLQEGWTNYGPSAGLPATPSSIAENTNREGGFAVEPDEVVVT